MTNFYEKMTIVPTTSDKKPLIKGDWHKSSYNINDLGKFENAGVIIPDGFVVVDFDDEKQAEIAVKIVKNFNLKTIITKTTRGVHIWFKIPKNNPNNLISQTTNTMTLCGLSSDLREGGKSFLIVKQNNKLREIIYKGVNKLEEVCEIPFIFWPNKTNSKERFNLVGLGNGSRTNTLHSYFCHLQNYRALWSYEEKVREHIIINSVKVANFFLLSEPLSENELTREVLHNNSVRTVKEMKETVKEAETEIIIKNNEINEIEEIANNIAGSLNIKFYNNSLYSYQNGYYQKYGNLNKLKKEVHDYYPNLTNFQIREIVERIQMITYVEKANSCKEVINLENGRYHTEHHIFLGHSSSIMETQRIPVKYDFENTVNEEIDKYRLELFGSQEMVDLIDEITGYVFLRKLPAQKFFIFWGGAGSGKSTYLNVIKNLVGNENYSSLSPKDMAENKFANSLMVDKLLNTIDEVDTSRVLKSTDKIKILACGQDMFIEEKYKEGYKAKIYATQICCLNDPLSFDDDALFDRFLIIPFTNRYRNTDNQLNEEEIYKFACSEAGKSYLFNKAMEGLKRLQDNNMKFSEVKEVQEAKETFMVGNDDTPSDVVLNFLNDQGIDENNIHEKGTSSEITNNFKAWCILNKKVFIGSTKFKNRVQELLNVEIKVCRNNKKIERRFSLL